LQAIEGQIPGRDEASGRLAWQASRR
jgi:hypothetical protein